MIINNIQADQKSETLETSIKDVIATVSYRVAISIPKARVAVQATCETFYNHQYYLSPNEQKKYASLEVIEEADEIVALTNESNKSFDTSSELPSKKARSKDSYNQKLQVCTTFKASSCGFQTSKTTQLLRPCVTKVLKQNLLYPLISTSRSRVDGEWPSLILNFKRDIPDENHMFMLTALFSTYEVHEQITKLVLETLNCLHVA